MSWLTLWIMMLMIFLAIPTSSAFLFPDLKALRTGSRVQSNYKIAVLQEEPFLSVNGTGYVQELLQSVASWYAASDDEGDMFPYEVIHVKTWNQLLTKASASNWQISFGLIASSLLRNDEPWRSMRSSSAVYHTGLKMVTMATATTSITSSSDNNNGQGSGKKTVPSTQTSEGVPLTGSRLDIKNATFLALEGSPEEHLLKKSPKYRNYLKVVQSTNEAVDQVHQNPDTFFVKDSAVARNLANQHESEMTAVCPKRGLTAGTQLYFGFFGKDVNIIHFLNAAFKKMRSGKDSLRNLNKKYFGHIRNCH